jgi:hypothetical protein
VKFGKVETGAVMSDNPFDLHLKRSTNGQLIVEAARAGQPPVQTAFTVAADKLDAALEAVAAGTASRTQLELTGDALLRALLPPKGELRSAYQQSRTQVDLGEAADCCLRLAIDDNVPAYPWELLRYEGTYLALDSAHSLVRYIPQPQEQASHIRLSNRFSVLHVLLTSDKALGAQHQTEAQGITDRLKNISSDVPFAIELDTCIATHHDEVVKALNMKQYHAVCLSGVCHSSKWGSAFSLDKDQPDYTADYLYADLKAAFGNDQPPIIVGVPNGVTAAERLFLSNMARTLVASGVPASVTLPTALAEPHRVNFLATFYNALVARFPIERAAVAGRAKMLIEAKDNQVSAAPWADVLVYSCVPDGGLYDLKVKSDEEPDGSTATAAGPSIPATLVTPPFAAGAIIINSRQITLGAGGVHAMGVGTTAIGSINISVGASAKAKQPSPIKIEISINLALEPPVPENDDQRLKVELNIASTPDFLSYEGPEKLTDITWAELYAWAVKLGGLRWALQRKENVWSMIEPDLSQQGQAIWARMLALDPDGRKQLEKALWSTHLEQGRISYQLIFRSHGQRLNSVPWELLNDGQNGFVCLAYPCYRYSEGDIPLSKFGKDLTRALIVAANPDPSLNLGQVDDVADEIDQLLKKQGFTTRVIKSVDADEDNILNALDQEKYQVFHFVGHGQEGDLDPSQNRLWVGKPGALEYLTAELLKSIIEKSDLRFAFLSACTSAQQPSTQEPAPWKVASLADAFVKAGVPAVIAMQWIVGETAARDWARKFYGCLSHYSIEEAMRLARLKTKSEMEMDWANPILAKRRGILEH